MGLGHWCGPFSDLRNMVEKNLNSWVDKDDPDAYYWRGSKINDLSKEQLLELVNEFIKRDTIRYKNEDR